MVTVLPTNLAKIYRMMLCLKAFLWAILSWTNLFIYLLSGLDLHVGMNCTDISYISFMIIFNVVGLWWSTLRADSLSRPKSYIPDKIEAGFVFDGALWKALPSSRKALQLLDSSSTRLQGKVFQKYFIVASL